ncbi:hypothetical protein AKN94_07160 [Thiopseudomonas alkaliphila]|uniref:type I-F CRISPR-associated protein Csy1 n=1 Tax=Thiopseudomonas alkaliphila TaxID=1697053 RepID=UPI00069EB1E0|nr:type I-F CRISPR-associated protein Csy1 [Thiopseudomonas alkaliphila]AKX47161.1 hypothetical protein AKN94_07160 [Thiopseudomonas alkaliphila]
MEPLSTRALQIKQLITDFIANRLAVKLEKLAPDDPKYQAEQDKHQYLTWLESAVTRVDGIQVVTHPLKATYPLAHIKKTTSLYCRPALLPQHPWVSTATLGTSFTDDVTGNAAGLDIYALLQQTIDNQTLLELCLNQDPDLQAALHPNPQLAEQWITALAQVTQPKREGVASHTLAKQLYWLGESDPYQDTDYTLLAPLYSSSLAQVVYEQIEADRFSPEAKEIRDAVRANQPHTGTARSYPNLAIQVIGGSNPQGVSLLASKRRGTNYLLASFPPQWQRQKKPPFHQSCIFQYAAKFRDIKHWITELQSFLNTNPANNLATRNHVTTLVDGLIDELYLFAVELQQLPASWTADAHCQLSIAQQCWLDPQRALQDAEFAEHWLTSTWDETIAQDFARWLNHSLSDKVQYLGDVEFQRWAKQLHRKQQWQNSIQNQLKTMEKRLTGSMDE